MGFCGWGEGRAGVVVVFVFLRMGSWLVETLLPKFRESNKINGIDIDGDKHICNPYNCRI